MVKIHKHTITIRLAGTDRDTSSVVQDLLDALRKANCEWSWDRKGNEKE